LHGRSAVAGGVGAELIGGHANSIVVLSANKNQVFFVQDIGGALSTVSFFKSFLAMMGTEMKFDIL